jgi:AbrB family looped-hinge helix DNA binding protein
MDMGHTLTVKGQVTIPKRVRDALGLKPGDEVDFIQDERGEIVVRRAGEQPVLSRVPDRFDRAMGSAPIKLDCSVDEYMELIRGPYPEKG